MPARTARGVRSDRLGASTAGWSGARLRMVWAYSENLHRRRDHRGAGAAVRWRRFARHRGPLRLARRGRTPTPSDFPLAKLHAGGGGSAGRPRPAGRGRLPAVAHAGRACSSTPSRPRLGRVRRAARSGLPRRPRALGAGGGLAGFSSSATRSCAPRSTGASWTVRSRWCMAVAEPSFGRDDWRALFGRAGAATRPAPPGGPRDRLRPLPRAGTCWRLIRTADREYRLLWSHHHIVLDGWSFNAVADELLATYRALASGNEPSSAAPPPLPRLSRLARSPGSGAVGGVLAPHARRLVRAHTDPGVAPPRPGGGRHRRDRDPPPVDVPHGAAGGGPPPPGDGQHAGQAAWSLLLGRHSGRQEVVFGVTVAGRPADLPGVESMKLGSSSTPCRCAWRSAETQALRPRSLAPRSPAPPVGAAPVRAQPARPGSGPERRARRHRAVR